MSDFDDWARGWREYDQVVLVEKFEERPFRIERALSIHPSEHSRFVWEWENASKAYDLDKLAQVAAQWAPRAVEVVMEHGKAGA